MYMYINVQYMQGSPFTFSDNIDIVFDLNSFSLRYTDQFLYTPPLLVTISNNVYYTVTCNNRPNTKQSV